LVGVRRGTRTRIISERVGWCQAGDKDKDKARLIMAELKLPDLLRLPLAYVEDQVGDMLPKVTKKTVKNYFAKSRKSRKSRYK
jgi:hypothetical protein